MGLVSNLYKLARFANDVSTIVSFNPKRIVRRFVLNKWIGKNVARKLYFKGSRKASNDTPRSL
jgi:hypothetical protein